MWYALKTSICLRCIFFFVYLLKISLFIQKFCKPFYVELKLCDCSWVVMKASVYRRLWFRIWSTQLINKIEFIVKDEIKKLTKSQIVFLFLTLNFRCCFFRFCHVFKWFYIQRKKTQKKMRLFIWNDRRWDLIDEKSEYDKVNYAVVRKLFVRWLKSVGIFWSISQILKWHKNVNSLQILCQRCSNNRIFSFKSFSRIQKP